MAPLVRSAMMLVVKSDAPAKSVQEFVAHAKANPGDIKYGHSGLGSPPHLGAMAFMDATGVQLTPVPYRGVGIALNDDRFVDAFARIETHYFVNKGYVPKDGWLIDQAAEKLRDIPTRIVHGRYDMCTPLDSAWKLKKAMPHAHLEIVPDAGHSSLEPGIVDALVRAGDWMGDNVRW